MMRGRYNGWEQHVMDRIKANETDFMPRNTTIVLRELQLAEAAESRELREAVVHVKAIVDKLNLDHTKSDVEAIGKAMDAQQLKLDQLNESLLTLSSQIQEMSAAAEQPATSNVRSMVRLVEL